jgi:membrane protein
LIKKSVKEFFDHDMETHSAALAYHVVFSLFPFSIFLIALLGFLDLSDFFDWLRQQAQSFLLPQTMEQVNQVFDQLQRRRIGLLSLGAVIALWAASSGMRAAMKALNVAYCVTEGRPAWKRYLLSVPYTVGVGIMLAAAAVLVAIAPRSMQAIALQLGVGQGLAVLWAWWLRWPAVVLLLTSAVAMVYAVAPDVEQRFRFITPGAFVAVIAWIAASLAFNWYVRNFASYNVLYGGVGTIIVLLLYFLISSVVLLLGAEMNTVIERHAPSGKQEGEKAMH